MRLACRAIAAVGVLAALPGTAAAGAWTRAAGDGQLIISSGRTVAPAGAWTGGAAEEDTSFTQVYVEYGLFDDLTLGANLFAEIDALDFASSSASLSLFARQRLWVGQHGDVASVQLAVSYPFEEMVLDQFDVPSTSDNAFAIELRGLYGKGWGFDWGNAFVSVEGGYRWRDGRSDEIRFDATGGVEPVKGVLGILSAFTLWPLQDDTDASVKIAPSVAWTMFPWIGDDGKKPRGPISPDTIQFGAIYDVLDPDGGLTLQISIWRSF